MELHSQGSPKAAWHHPRALGHPSCQPCAASRPHCAAGRHQHPVKLVPEGEEHPQQDQGQSSKQEDLLEEQGKPGSGDNQAKQLEGYRATGTTAD